MIYFKAGLSELSDRQQEEVAQKLLESGSTLKKTDKGLTLFYKDRDELCFDFLKDWEYHQKQHYSLRREHLARAVFPSTKPVKEASNWIVVDASSGTGHDTLLLLSFGFKVMAFERNPLVALLLKDAWERALVSPSLGLVVKERLQFICADFCSWHSLNLSSHPNKLADSFYFDPMYDKSEEETKLRKALPRQEMRIFHELLGPDDSAQKTLEYALTLGFRRLAVKRPVKGAALLLGESGSIVGKSARYDLYTSTGLIEN